MLPAAGSGSSNLEPFVQIAATLPGKSVRDVARKVVQLHVSGAPPPPRARARAPRWRCLPSDTTPPRPLSHPPHARTPARQQAEAKAAAATAAAAAAARGGGGGGAAASKRGGGAAAAASSSSSSSSSGSFKHKARIASLLKANLEHVAAMRKNLLALKLDDNLALVAKFRDSVDEALLCLEGVGVRMPPLPVQVNTGLLAAKEAGDALAAAAAAAAASSAAATGAGAAADGGGGGAGAAASAPGTSNQ